MDVQEDAQNKRGRESDTTEDADVNEDTATEVPLPQILNVVVEVDELAPFERVQQQMPVPQILKETAEVDLLVAYERVQQQLVEIPMPQTL